MRYAIIKLNGKQYRVSPGETIEAERLNFKPGEKIIFAEVLLTAFDNEVTVGTPQVEGAVVRATVIGDLKGEKVRVAKFKAKVRYRRLTGKRQSLTRLKIDEIAFKTTQKKVRLKVVACTEEPSDEVMHFEHLDICEK